MTKSKYNNKKLELIINYLKDKKLLSLKILDISKISIIADYFIIISVNNIRTVEAIKDEIEDLMSKNKYYIRNNEKKNCKWVLMDYDDIIIHIFDDEYYKFYNLEKLWADAIEVN